ncbi:hypothetical protein AALP_AAs62636U000100 [Arabis alpina]|uniref:Uncharacterized protein n=1 Tax=Arabis alpina TaxID=50452 RepID=A0A087G133_ARAAL|nr:hypothetical protein AALP_AAs62636U000100 [Arabis alpina]
MDPKELGSTSVFDPDGDGFGVMLPRRLDPDVVTAGTRRTDNISATSLWCLDADDLRATASSPSGLTEDVRRGPDVDRRRRYRRGWLGTRSDSDTEVAGGMFPLNDEDSGFPFAPLSSSSTSSRASSAKSDDEDTIDEVQQTKKTKKAKKKAKVKVRPNPPGSSLLDARSLQRLWRKCGISEEIVLVASSLAGRADAPPPGYMTLFENYFDQCLL